VAVQLEVQAVFVQASMAHTVLVSQLAQYRGLVRFGFEFASRAPPPELRVALPEVERDIETKLLELELLLARLTGLRAATAPGSRDSLVCEALAQHLKVQVVELAQAELEEQRQTLRNISQRSPLLSVTISDSLTAKLTAVVRSTTPSPRCSRSPSPRGSRCNTPPTAWRDEYRDASKAAMASAFPPALDLGEAETVHEADELVYFEATIDWGGLEVPPGSLTPARGSSKR
jgi:hypothetical protein